MEYAIGYLLIGAALASSIYFMARKGGMEGELIDLAIGLFIVVFWPFAIAFAIWCDFVDGDLP